MPIDLEGLPGICKTLLGSLAISYPLAVLGFLCPGLCIITSFCSLMVPALNLICCVVPSLFCCAYPGLLCCGVGALPGLCCAMLNMLGCVCPSLLCCVLPNMVGGCLGFFGYTLPIWGCSLGCCTLSSVTALLGQKILESHPLPAITWP